MATITVYPSTATPFNGIWTNVDRIYADDDSEVSVKPPYYETEGEWYLDFVFPSCNIPTGSIINSVKLECEMSCPGGIGATEVSIQAMYGSTNKGEYSTHSPSYYSTVYTNTHVGTWTISELNSGSAGAWIGVIRINRDLSPTLYIDYIRMVVNYTPPAPKKYYKTLRFNGASFFSIKRKNSLSKNIIFKSATNSVRKRRIFKKCITRIAASPASIRRKTTKKTILYGSSSAPSSKVIFKLATPTVSAATNISRQIFEVLRKILDVSISASSNGIKKIFRGFSFGSNSSSPVTKKMPKVIYTAVSSFSSTLAVLVVVIRKIIDTTMAASSNIGKGIFKAVTVPITHAVSIPRKVFKIATAGASNLVPVTKKVSKSFEQAVSISMTVLHKAVNVFRKTVVVSVSLSFSMLRESFVDPALLKIKTIFLRVGLRRTDTDYLTRAATSTPDKRKTQAGIQTRTGIDADERKVETEVIE